MGNVERLSDVVDLLQMPDFKREGMSDCILCLGACDCEQIWPYVERESVSR